MIESMIQQDWSPEQTSAWFKTEQGIYVSHERIYKYILANERTGGDLHHHLRYQKKREKRYGSYARRGQLSNRVSIDERPAIVDTPKRLGD